MRHLSFAIFVQFSDDYDDDNDDEDDNDGDNDDDDSGDKLDASKTEGEQIIKNAYIYIHMYTWKQRKTEVKVENKSEYWIIASDSFKNLQFLFAISF